MPFWIAVPHYVAQQPANFYIHGIGMGFTRRKKPQKPQKRKQRNQRNQRNNRTNQKTRRRIQNGGVTGSNLRFQYTKNPNRVSWVTAVTQYGAELIRMITYIPYNLYRFEGECDIFMETDSNNNKPVEFSMKSVDEPRGTIKRYEGSSVAPNTPYIIFGGTACEIYNMIYPRVANLHELTDPTGDIDIRLYSPNFIPRDVHTYGIPIMYTKKYGYNPVSDHYTRWLMDHIRNILEIISTKYEKSFETHGFIPAFPKDTDEASIADVSIQVGPFLICRLYYNGMIKIQAIAKIQLPDGSEYADHFMEFIMLVNEEGYDDKPLQGDYITIDNIIVESPLKLLNGQIKGLKDRQPITAPASLHKLINHYGRLMYITKLIRWLVENKIIPKPDGGLFSSLVDTLKSPAFDRADVCEPPRGCSAFAILEPILPFFQKGYPITKKAKSIRNPEAIKGPGNLQYIEANLFQ